MAVPRVAPHGGGGGLPQPLAPSEAARVTRIFALQAAGRVSEAARETSALIDPTLLGHILADRYLGAAYRSTADDLGGWLEAYGDHPDAGAIYELLKRRAPKGAVLPAAPANDALAPRPMRCRRRRRPRITAWCAIRRWITRSRSVPSPGTWRRRCG